MCKRKEIYRKWKKIAAMSLTLALLLALCSACGGSVVRPGDESSPVLSDPGRSGISPIDQPIMPVQNIDAEKIDANKGIETYNVVLVIDSSASAWDSSPDRSWLEAPCMFLNSLYASADRENTERLPGCRNANADVIFYNDEIDWYSDSVQSLSMPDTVEKLKKFIRNPVYHEGSGDSALGEALEKAVDILYDHTRGMMEITTRSIIMLYTDGYSRSSPSPSNVSAVREATPQATLSRLSNSNASSAQTPNAWMFPQNGQADTDASGGFPFPVMPEPPMPNFGGSVQKTLENALKTARARQYETFVLMMNPNNDKSAYWEEFKKIADYTERTLVPSFTDFDIEDFSQFLAGLDTSQMPDFSQMEMPEWPADFPMIRPSYTKDPLFGGGLFNDKERTYDLVNYYTAKNPVGIQGFYVQMAAVMLSGRQAKALTGGVSGDRTCYEIDIPDSGISAAVFYALSADGIVSNNLIGPNPDNPVERKDYKDALTKQTKDGWDESRKFHNSWYGDGNKLSRFATLTVMEPEAGKWQFFVKGNQDKNQSLYAFVALVSGVDVNVYFMQGADGANAGQNIAEGDFVIRFTNQNGNLSDEFYRNVKSQCSIMMWPSGWPIMKPEDMESVSLTDMIWTMFPMQFQQQIDWTNMPPMRGGAIEFKPGVDADGNQILTGRYTAPYPGIYAVELEMIFDGIDYSQSFYVSYAPKTGKALSIDKMGSSVTLQAPFLDGAWGELETKGELKLTLVDKSWEVNPPDFALVEPNDDKSALDITAMDKGKGEITFKVKSEDGDKWTVTCPITVKK